MNIADHFIEKETATRAFTTSEKRDRYDHVVYDGMVYFYDLPENTNSEDFAAAVSVAFEVEADPRDVINWDGVYRLDIE